MCKASGLASGAKPAAASTIDQSAGLGRVAVIVGSFTAAMCYALQPLDSPGTIYHDSAVMGALLSWPMVYIAPLAYVCAVMAGCRLMSQRASIKPFLKQYVQPVYNVFQIVMCSYMVWGLAPKVDVLGLNPFAMNTERDKKTEWFMFVHYLSKFVDWTDTFLMIGSKSFRQVSFLQVFHHATVGMIWGALLRKGWGGGTCVWGAFINSVTHVLMYTHYLVTSLGLHNPLKSQLTNFQLAQFASCVLHAALVFASETVLPARLAYIQLVYHPTLLFLFGFQMKWVPSWITGQTITGRESEAPEKKVA
jgi:hypothetical protein|mmetsp:Transcript_25197/g.73620  ORF Transcript_25197/g.73620 Transcript_25197/m.73620 type:complete len:306 (-) Transcript_25197:318-1235(-)